MRRLERVSSMRPSSAISSAGDADGADAELRLRGVRVLAGDLGAEAVAALVRVDDGHVGRLADEHDARLGKLCAEHVDHRLGRRCSRPPRRRRARCGSGVLQLARRRSPAPSPARRRRSPSYRRCRGRRGGRRARPSCRDRCPRAGRWPAPRPCGRRGRCRRRRRVRWSRTGWRGCRSRRGSRCSRRRGSPDSRAPTRPSAMLVLWLVVSKATSRPRISLGDDRGGGLACATSVRTQLMLRLANGLSSEKPGIATSSMRAVRRAASGSCRP